MKPFIQVQFDDGSVFEVPTIVIANNRAAFYHKDHPDEFPEFDDALKDSTELFASDDYEISDWAKNNMNWEDLAPHARMVAFTPVERDWMTAGITSHDESSPVAPLGDGEEAMSLPLDFALMRIASMQRICTVMPVGDAAAPSAIMAFIVGGPQVAKFYSDGLNQLTAAIANIKATGSPSLIITE